MANGQQTGRNRTRLLISGGAFVVVVVVGFLIRSAISSDQGTSKVGTPGSSSSTGLSFDEETDSSTNDVSATGPGGGIEGDEEDDSDAALPTSQAPSSDACGELPCGVGIELPNFEEATLRVNVGGEVYEDQYGLEWSNAGCSGEAYTSPNAIRGTVDDHLFQSRRFEPQCEWEVPSGRYAITVGWAETYRDEAGYRKFPLVIEGRGVATIDVAAAAGMDTTYLQSFLLDVIDGSLAVAAPEQENRPMIALVAATRVGDAPPPPPPPEVGDVLEVGAGSEFGTLQEALDASAPGVTIRLATPGPHPGPAVSRVDGAEGAPITLTAVEGAWLECGSPDDGQVARCFELGHSFYVFDGFSVTGGSSNLYMVGHSPGAYVHDVRVVNSTFRGSPLGGTGECIRVKYQAYNVEIGANDIADCGLGKCCDDSKNGEGVYIGTAPEQLSDKNPSPEPDRTHGVWVHDNRIHSLNECVEVKEAAYGNVVEHNTCSGQSDPDSGGFGARGGRVGAGNTFRFNLVMGAVGACVRFGGDDEPDGTGNDFYGNECRDIGGEYGVKQMMLPQGLICGNSFSGGQPSSRLSRDEATDPTAPCPSGTPTTSHPPGHR